MSTPPVIHWIARAPDLHEARVVLPNGRDIYAGYVAAIPCVTCGERPPQPGRFRCHECLDAEWLRLRAKDPPWCRSYHGDHRHG